MALGGRQPLSCGQSPYRTRRNSHRVPELVFLRSVGLDLAFVAILILLRQWVHVRTDTPCVAARRIAWVSYALLIVNCLNVR